jgi:hypothetical protein
MESYLIIILLSVVIIYKYINASEVIYTDTFVDGKKKKYLVRNVEDKDIAAKTLLMIELSLLSFVKKLLEDDTVINDINMYKYVKNLNGKINNITIQESSADSKYTSYSVNKGEMLVFCLRSKKDSKIHDLNELMYVAIHELAHIACPEIGHTDLFFTINKYLIKKAIDYGTYKYINYSLNNTEYCGMILTTSVINQ